MAATFGRVLTGTGPFRKPSIPASFIKSSWAALGSSYSALVSSIRRLGARDMHPERIMLVIILVIRLIDNAAEICIDAFTGAPFLGFFEIVVRKLYGVLHDDPHVLP